MPFRVGKAKRESGSHSQSRHREICGSVLAGKIVKPVKRRTRCMHKRYCIDYDDRNCTTGYCGPVVTVFIMLSCYSIHYDNRNCTIGYCGRVVTVFIIMIGKVLL